MMLYNRAKMVQVGVFFFTFALFGYLDFTECYTDVAIVLYKWTHDVTVYLGVALNDWLHAISFLAWWAIFFVFSVVILRLYNDWWTNLFTVVLAVNVVLVRFFIFILLGLFCWNMHVSFHNILFNSHIMYHIDLSLTLVNYVMYVISFLFTIAYATWYDSVDGIYFVVGFLAWHAFFVVLFISNKKITTFIIPIFTDFKILNSLFYTYHFYYLFVGEMVCIYSLFSYWNAYQNSVTLFFFGLFVLLIIEFSCASYLIYRYLLFIGTITFSIRRTNLLISSYFYILFFVLVSLTCYNYMLWTEFLMSEQSLKSCNDYFRNRTAFTDYLFNVVHSFFCDMNPYFVESIDLLEKILIKDEFNFKFEFERLTEEELLLLFLFLIWNIIIMLSFFVIVCYLDEWLYDSEICLKVYNWIIFIILLLNSKD